MAHAADGLPDLPPLPGVSSAYAAPAAYGNSLGVQTSLADVAKLQSQLKDINDQASAIKDEQDRLSTEIRRLLNSTGVHFGGQAVVDSDNLLRLVPTGPALRLWPTVGYFDFTITARPTPLLSATVTYRMEKVFGEFWGAGDIAGVKWFNVHGDTPIGFDLGMFHYKDTSLTFWAPSDSYPFEPLGLARKRSEGQAGVDIADDSFPLQGGLLNATALLFGSLDMELEALGVRTAISGNRNSSLAFSVIFPYDQYIVGGTMHLTGDKNKMLRAGLNYFELMESPDTNLSAALFTQQRGNVVSADAKLSLFSNSLSLRLEDAASNYTPAYTPLFGSSGNVIIPAADWTQGSAQNAFVDFKAKNTQLHLDYVNVGQGFINYAAQTRQTDDMRQPGEPIGDLPTGNNLYNPHDGSFNLATVTNLYFDQYNSSIFASNQAAAGGLMLVNNQQPAGIYLTHGFLSQSLPEGFATPNRNGFGGEFDGNYFGGLIQPTLLGSVYSEVQNAYNVPSNTGPRTYTRGGGGLKMDLSALLHLPLVLSAGVVSEDTHASQFVDFTSTRVAYDALWQAFKGLGLELGFEHIDFNGADFFDFGAVTGPQWVYLNWLVDNYVAGFDWNVSKSTDFYLTYSFQDAVDAQNGSANYQNQEWQTKLTMRF